MNAVHIAEPDKPRRRLSPLQSLRMAQDYLCRVEVALQHGRDTESKVVIHGSLSEVKEKLSRLEKWLEERK